ncbi:MAG: hydrogenase expression/formation protein HypE [Gemmatimonadota bacterium]
MSTQTLSRTGVSCPTPIPDRERVQLGHGSGGKMSGQLLAERFLPRFANAALSLLGDGAAVRAQSPDLVVSTDTFVVSPLEFPGGNIGTLAVHGTLNDVAMMGADPLYLAAGFVLEEGLPFDVLDRVLDSMQDAVAKAGVQLVTGDTKVVERGKADGMFINTTGIGFLHHTFHPRPDEVHPGDAVLVSGPLGCHGIAVMAARGEIGFEVDVESDSASLHPLVVLLRERCGSGVHALRDPTRGGLASALNEIARASGVGFELEGIDAVLPEPVAAACEMLGLDPLYVANEGVLVAIVDAEHGERALAALRSHPLGQQAQLVGRAVDRHPGLVVLRTGLGGSRIVDLLPGDQLPRIC